MPVFDFSCFASKPKTDPETGCILSSSCGDTSNNSRIAYEQCRQAYFLKQQNIILDQNKTNSVQNQSSTSNLETPKNENLELKYQAEITQKNISIIEADYQKQLMVKNIINYFLIFIIIILLIFIGINNFKGRIIKLINKK